MDSGLRELLREVECGVLAVLDDRVEFVNPALLTLFDVVRTVPDVADWHSASSLDLIDAVVANVVDGAAFRTRCRAAVDNDTAVTEDLTTVDGRTLECDFQPVGRAADRRGYLLLVWDVSPDRAEATDRTRRQHAEIIAGQLGARAHRARADEAERTGRRLAARNRELAATDAARVELLATASHELRTPLTSILSFSELLADADSGGGADQVVQYAEIVQRNARRLLDTVEDLLMLAGLGSSPHPPSTAPVELGPLIRQTVEDLGPAAADAGVEIVLDLGPVLTVRGDADELVRMVCNVLDNAVKYSEPGGRVDVAATTDGAVLRLVVTDRGSGIPADEVELVFGQFYRASTARASDRPGTGLGLAIAQGVAAHHGGTIVLTSTLGTGTTVTMELPLARSAG